MNDDRFIAVDIISKVIIVAVLAFWAITSYSLCTLKTLLSWVCHWLRRCTDKRQLLS
ncbi:BnaAnng41560D [Brassica napus]|uniref:BnaAnng41560D protein n=1 Tax=Brassica napus TaxID=3708 RepID=A0A078K3V2_BRANA|nr:BnaAnng41560D [Brassica napus]